MKALFYATTLSVGTSTAVELTSGVSSDGPFVLLLRIPANDQSLGPVRIGTSGVGTSQGYSLDSQTPGVTLNLESGDKVYGIAQSNSTSVDVLAYSGGVS